ncbi:MAG TPA: beta-ketoacyl-ACP reductase, partial [Cyanothece sp. UBA12306]|nr:beta-ketoacyl-ACP reductase [Cyanothece sp. UBA12306]
KAIALALASQGLKVVVNYARSSTAAEEVVQTIVDGGGEAIAVQGDVSKTEEVDSLIKTTLDKFGRIDVLVNN